MCTATRYASIMHISYLVRQRDTVLYMSTGSMDADRDCTSHASSSLSTGEAVAITAVVAGLCSLVAGLLLGVLLARCTHCHWKTDQAKVQRPPVYEDIPADRKSDMELKHNEAYGHINI